MIYIIHSRGTDSTLQLGPDTIAVLSYSSDIFVEVDFITSHTIFRHFPSVTMIYDTSFETTALECWNL